MWSDQQEMALKEIRVWLRRPQQQVFRLFGYAGTGKTTIAQEVAGMVRGKAVYAAFTGKAALVMRARGCHNASTIHSLIYRLDEDGTNPDTGEPTFMLNVDSEVENAKIVIIDECSMVDEELGADLLSFGKPVLVLGDQAQLPPVKGGGFFTAQDPDVMLTEIHRQARDNPIIRMSMDVREGRRLEYGKYGSSRVISRKDIDSDAVLAADQVLVGTNRTRRTYNNRIRSLRGFHDSLPMAGERMIGLKNDRKRGLLNGALWDVACRLPPEENDAIAEHRPVRLRLQPVDAIARADMVDTKIHPLCIDDRLSELQWWQRRDYDEFTYGYAITVHKAQGSQWRDVIVFDESAAFREDRSRWLYTAVTRASERLTVVA